MISLTLLYVSQYFRKYILDKNYIFIWQVVFAHLYYIKKNAFDLLQKIYNNDDLLLFDFEKICPEVEVTLRHLSLF